MASASLSGFSMSGGWTGSFRPQLPLPPITYPPCFGKGCTLRYFMHSKLLALSFIILGIAFLVVFICAFLPYWFILKFNRFDSTFGTEGFRQLQSDVGVFFYDEQDYASLLFLEKMSNRLVVPREFTVSQVTEMVSLCALACTFVGTGILAFRKYSSVTGVLFLAALASITALCQVLMVIFCIITISLSSNGICEPSDAGCQYTKNLPWRNLPFHEQFFRITQHTTPQINANWAFYIAIIGAILSVIGCIILWVEGLTLCKTVGGIRYKQLRETRDVHENEKDPTDFIFSPSARTTSRAHRPPQYSYAAEVLKAPPMPRYTGPPSISGVSSHSQGSSAFISREVDFSFQWINCSLSMSKVLKFVALYAGHKMTRLKA